MKVRHDIHTHTLFSSCCYDPEATAAAYIEKAHELGHSVFGFSNHIWDENVPGASNWYKGQTVGYGLEEKDAIPSDTHGIKVLFGTETEYCGMTNNLGMLAETAKKFDYVLVPHSHTHQKNFVMAENPDVKAYRKALAAQICENLPGITEEQAQRMAATVKYQEALAAIKDPTVDDGEYLADFLFTSFESLMVHPEFLKLAATVPTLIAHPFHPCGESKEQHFRVLGILLAHKDRLFDDFSTAARLNVGLDVNIGTYRMPEDYANDPMVAIMRIARDAGCKFGFGTDSHTLRGLENIRNGDAIGEAIGITEKDLAEII